VYLPPEAAGDPAGFPRRAGVLVIHGGSWIGGSKSEYGPQFARLVEHGCVVFAADYRLARPGEPGWPGAVDDLRAAVRWIRRHSEEFLVDPNRIVALGSGAGGHLALLLGTLPDQSLPGDLSGRVQAVVSLYGPTDLADLMQRRGLTNDPARVFLGETSAASTSQYDTASPVNQVRGDEPPMLLIHGSDDSWVPVEQARRLSNALARARVKHRLIVVPGARHGFELEFGPPEERDLLPELLAFLETVWQVHLGDQP
jgi:acetyl esterase/lipase